MATTLNSKDVSGNKSTTVKNGSAFIICLLIPLAVGALSGYITHGEMMGWWFMNLNKPVFNPPNGVFGPVWTLLYCLMGVSLYLVWKSPKTRLRRNAIFVFSLQLFLNFWWSILFFSFHLLFVSIIDISIMWILILYMIILFRKTKPNAGYINIPYLMWVSFATVLNISIWVLNSTII
ncbi:MAG: TspO/MBR family protein [Bacteroidia bacterium]